MRLSTFLLPLVGALALGLCGDGAPAADEVAEIGARGVVQGDIAGPGDTDTIGLDLVAGSTVDVKYAAAFEAVIELRDPGGEEVPLTFTNGRKRAARKVPILRTGRHELTISSAGEDGGGYELVARARWAKKLTFDGETAGAFDVGLPVGGSVRATVKSRRQSKLTPGIESLAAPDDAELVGRVDGARRKVKLPKTVATQDGVHALRVDAGGDGPFRVVVRRKVPSVKATKVDLREPPTPVSFEGDGVKAIFSRSCTGCHSWASSYLGVRARASNALSRIQTGSMPLFSPKLPKSEIQLVKAWVDGGRAP